MSSLLHWSHPPAASQTEHNLLTLQPGELLFRKRLLFRPPLSHLLSLLWTPLPKLCHLTRHRLLMKLPLLLSKVLLLIFFS